VSQRHTWTFQYESAEVKDAAKEKAEYHRQHQGHWGIEAAAAEAAVKEKGIEVRGVEQTGGRRAEVVLDQPLARALDEAQQKRDSHRKQAEEYESWVAVLEAAPDKTLELEWDDISFFGLAKTAENA
jgi:hypothetical protein